MSPVTISLFGPAEVRCTISGAVLPLGRSAMGLLAWLALYATTPMPREVVAEALWPECDQDRARSRLSTALWRLRSGLAAAERGVLHGCSDGCLGLTPAAAATVDTRQFESAAHGYLTASDDSGWSAVAGPRARGIAMAGWYPIWALSAQVRLEDLRERCLAARLERLVGADQYEHAVDTANALLALDPLAEEVHRALMILHFKAGRPGMALRQYNRCRAALHEELGVPPSVETDAVRTRVIGAAAAADGQNPINSAAVNDLRQAITDTQQSLARVADRLDTLFCR